MDIPLPQNIPICPHCHVSVRTIDYFCFNCGSELHPKPLSLTATKILSIVFSSIIFPPMGIVWGYRYAKEKDPKIRSFGVAMIVITVALLIVSILASVQLIQSIQNQVNSQLQNLQMF